MRTVFLLIVLLKTADSVGGSVVHVELYSFTRQICQVKFNMIHEGDSRYVTDQVRRITRIAKQFFQNQNPVPEKPDFRKFILTLVPLAETGEAPLDINDLGQYILEKLADIREHKCSNTLTFNCICKIMSVREFWNRQRQARLALSSR